MSDERFTFEVHASRAAVRGLRGRYVDGAGLVVAAESDGQIRFEGVIVSTRLSARSAECMSHQPAV